jgi:AraC-like DNA-binding protein
LTGPPVSKGISMRNWFIFITEGKGNANIDGQKYPIVKGSLVTLHTNSHFAICPDTRDYISYYALGFLYQFHGSASQKVNIKNKENFDELNFQSFKHPIEIKNAIIIEKVLSSMHDVSLYSELSSNPKIKYYFYKLLTCIMDDIQYGLNSMSIYKRIEKSIQYISDNFNKKITLDKLADKCCVSKEYYIRKFKEHVGVTPIQYLLSIRINKAKVFLLQNYKVSEVSEIVGFNDQVHFSKYFKKSTGVSPAYFKNSNIY